MTDKLQQKLESIGNHIAKREAAKIYQFPLWPEPKRGVPNSFARSALFSATKGRDSEALKEVIIASQGDYSIQYTGLRLNQDDLDVYEAVMHLAREQPENEFIQFTTHGLLKVIGRQMGGMDHERLKATLTVLTATSVSILRKGRRIYWGSLIPEGIDDTESQVFRVLVNRRLIKFFEEGYTVVEQEHRKALARSPLARHLQCWIASHDKPYPVTVEYLQRLSGSKTRELKKFRQSLRNALKKLVEVGVIEDWKIDKTDKVFITKYSAQ